MPTGLCLYSFSFCPGPRDRQRFQEPAARAASTSKRKLFLTWPDFPSLTRSSRRICLGFISQCRIDEDVSQDGRGIVRPLVAISALPNQETSHSGKADRPASRGRPLPDEDGTWRQCRQSLPVCACMSTLLVGRKWAELPSASDKLDVEARVAVDQNLSTAEAARATTRE